LRLGYINFGAQDGRFHTAKYTIAELTLLIGTMQFRPSSSADRQNPHNVVLSACQTQRVCPKF
jgi:hypothetical protein